MKNFNTYISEKLKITKRMLGNQSIKKMLDNPEDYVDLCLPSGTLWAKCNVGANEEYEIGDLISWGEIKPKRKYIPDTYKFGNEDNLTKYNDTDKLTKLELTDDIAYYKDKNMCLPSNEQFQELIDNTKNEWVKNYNGTGVNGMLFTAKNGNTLFLPAAGEVSYLDNRKDSINFNGCYMSSTLDQKCCERASALVFSEHTKIRLPLSYVEPLRSHGFSIRPVINK